MNFKPWNKNNCQPIILYPEKLSFKIEGELKNFHNKYTVMQFMTTKLTLQKIHKGALYTEEEESIKSQERTNLIKRIDKQMVIKNESIINNSINQQTTKIRKGWITSHLAIITLNINWLNSPIKRCRLAE
jgi:hypothetical protein